MLLQAVGAGLPANMTNDEGKQAALMRIPALISNTSDTAGNTLLMLAAYNGQADLVKGLVEKGADVNRVNDRGQSPLAGVVFKGYDEIAHILIENGADPNAGTPTALQTAQMFNKTQLLALMQQHSTQSSRQESVPLQPATEGSAST